MNAQAPVPTTELSFRELIAHYGRVRIPVIQRDYTQGRDSAHEVRDEFLDALYTALAREPGDPALPLNLDFVYGRIEDRAGFAPLDGQQRLTTLFLLHWYLAWHDGEYADFASFMREGDSSRFGYAIRTSSREFFDALSDWVPAFEAREDTLPKGVVRDQNWFFDAWNDDPTVQAALSMLDAIHRRFYGTRAMYARLARAERPYVTLHLLDLDNFALVDDLYIKMNARGKPLTPFEHFKAQLEAHLAAMPSPRAYPVVDKLVTLKEYVSHRIDGAWTDLFWHALNDEPTLLDQGFMRLIHVIVIVSRDAHSFDDELLTELHNATAPLSFRRYQEADCLNQAFVETLIAVLDAWSGAETGMRAVLGDSPYFDERAVFDAILRADKRWTYAWLVQFHVYAAFIRHYGHAPERGHFRDWMRVMANLAHNSAFDSVSAFRLSLATVNRLLPHASTVLDYLASGPTELRGFSSLQADEERVKAALILRSDAWRERVERAEQHGYFQGQIGFLLKFAGVRDAWHAASGIGWTPQQDDALRQHFGDYHLRALALFDDKGLRYFRDAVFERALLTIGDYLLQEDSNRSFGENNGRDTSWKRLLRGNANDDGDDAKRRAMFQTLLDRIDPDAEVAQQLADIVETAPLPGDWREPFIRCAKMIAYCGLRLIRFHNHDHNRIYLLSKQRMSGAHAELYTYHLYLSELGKMVQAGDLAPFREAKYVEVCTDREEPFIRLRGECSGAPLVLEIRHNPATACFAFTLTASVAMSAVEQLAAAGFVTITDGKLDRAVPRSDAISALLETARALHWSEAPQPTN